MTMYPAFPLSIAHLPGDIVTLNVFEPRFLSLVDNVVTGEGKFVSVLIARGNEVGGGDTRMDCGVSVRVEKIVKGDRGLGMFGLADSVLTITDWLPDDPYPRAVTEPQAEESISSKERFDIASSLTLLAQRCAALRRRLGRRAGELTVHGAAGFEMVAEGRWWTDEVNEEELWRAFWVVGRSMPCGPLDRYSLLRKGSLAERVTRLKLISDHVVEVAEFSEGTH